MGGGGSVNGCIIVHLLFLAKSYISTPNSDLEQFTLNKLGKI
jgi:hypothetical protein